MLRRSLLALALLLCAVPSWAARNFVRASGHYIHTATLPVTTTPFTICGWGKSGDDTVTQGFVTIGRTATEEYCGIRFRGNISGDPIYASCIVGGSTTGAAISTTGYVAGQWHLVCGIFASTTSRTVYLDGGSSATETTSVDPTSENILTIGRTSNSSVPTFSGDIAEVTIWDVALTASDAAAMWGSKCIRCVRSESIVFSPPLLGRADPEVDLYGGTLTVVGAAYAAHPAVVYPFEQPEIFWDTPAAAGGQPTMRRWEHVPYMPSGRGRGGIKMLVGHDFTQEALPCVGCPQ